MVDFVSFTREWAGPAIGAAALVGTHYVGSAIAHKIGLQPYPFTESLGDWAKLGSTALNWGLRYGAPLVAAYLGNRLGQNIL